MHNMYSKLQTMHIRHLTLYLSVYIANKPTISNQTQKENFLFHILPCLPAIVSRVCVAGNNCIYSATLWPCNTHIETWGCLCDWQQPVRAPIFHVIGNYEWDWDGAFKREWRPLRPGSRRSVVTQPALGVPHCCRYCCCCCCYRCGGKLRTILKLIYLACMQWTKCGVKQFSRSSPAGLE